VALVLPALGEPNEPRLPLGAEPVGENMGDTGKGGRHLSARASGQAQLPAGVQEETRTSHLLLLGVRYHTVRNLPQGSGRGEC
jgi:hypothetical protein